MWVNRHQSWIATVFLGGFVLPRIWTRTLIVTGISVLVTFVYHQVPYLHVSLKTAPFVMMGLPLGIFLGFRNNTAYDRFWDARKLWGALVNTSRSLTRQVMTLIESANETDEVRKLEMRFANLLIAHVHALRHHLRDSSPVKTLSKFLPADELARLEGDPNPALALIHRMGEVLAEARRRKWIDPFHVNILEGSLVSLTDIQGACERIKATPIPYSYTVLMHRIVAGYCTLLPFGLAEEIGWATPVVVLGISYAFFGLDAIGDEIEDPFGLDTNDLPLKALARKIEIDVRRLVGDTFVPQPTKPHRGILS